MMREKESADLLGIADIDSSESDVNIHALVQLFNPSASQRETLRPLQGHFTIDVRRIPGAPVVLTPDATATTETQRHGDTKKARKSILERAFFVSLCLCGC